MLKKVKHYISIITQEIYSIWLTANHSPYHKELLLVRKNCTLWVIPEHMSIYPWLGWMNCCFSSLKTFSLISFCTLTKDLCRESCIRELFSVAWLKTLLWSHSVSLLLTESRKIIVIWAHCDTQWLWVKPLGKCSLVGVNWNWHTFYPFIHFCSSLFPQQLKTIYRGMRKTYTS